MVDRHNYFQSYKGAEEGILLVRVNSGRWSQVEPGAVDSKSGCFALITHYLPPASNTPTYPSSSQPAIPTQGETPKSGLSIYPTAHILSYFLRGPVERANQNCRRKRVPVSEAKCGGLPWEARRAPTTKPRMSWYTSIYKPCVFYMSWCTSKLEALICHLCVTYMYFKLKSILFENCLIKYRSMLKLYVFDAIVQLQEEKTGQKFWKLEVVHDNPPKVVHCIIQQIACIFVTPFQILLS